MFKRLFILSGVIAFLLAFAVTWFWYLPQQEATEASQIEIEADTTSSKVVETEF